MSDQVHDQKPTTPAVSAPGGGSEVLRRLRRMQNICAAPDDAATVELEIVRLCERLKNSSKRMMMLCAERPGHDMTPCDECQRMHDANMAFIDAMFPNAGLTGTAAEGRG